MLVHVDPLDLLDADYPLAGVLIPTQDWRLVGEWKKSHHTFLIRLGESKADLSGAWVDALDHLTAVQVDQLHAVWYEQWLDGLGWTHDSDLCVSTIRRKLLRQLRDRAAGRLPPLDPTGDDLVYGRPAERPWTRHEDNELRRCVRVMSRDDLLDYFDGMHDRDPDQVGRRLVELALTEGGAP